jgi:hypothetical protein
MAEAFVFADDELLPYPAWSYLVRRRAGFKCERCEKAVRLGAHHRDRDKKNCRLENGECLCASCHRAEHNNDPGLLEKLRGREFSLEHRENIAAGLRAAHERGAFDAAPAKISAKLTGKTLSDEHRAALSDAQQRRRDRERAVVTSS